MEQKSELITVVEIYVELPISSWALPVVCIGSMMRYGLGGR